MILHRVEEVERVWFWCIAVRTAAVIGVDKAASKGWCIFYIDVVL